MKHDDSRSPFSGLEWLERLGSIVGGVTVVAGALAWIVAFFFPDVRESAQSYATLGAILIAVGGFAFFFYRRRRARRYKIAPSAAPTEPSAALRGLLPFEEGDHLPGRAQDAQQLFTLVTNRNFHFGVLWGQSGSGKTSLLRASVVPALKQNGHVTVYVPRPTQDPQAATRSALVKEFPELKTRASEPLDALLESITPRGKHGVILLDQFEEFFLLNRTPASREPFVKWLGQIVGDADSRLAVLVNIRSDSFAQLQNLAPAVPEPTSPRTTYQLLNFTTMQAKQVFDEAVRSDAVPFDPELIDAVVGDLEVEGYLRPAELQILGTRLKSKNIHTLNRYEVEGRAQGILSSYVVEEIKYSPNQDLARLVLRLMLADPVEAKSPQDLSLDDIVLSLKGPAPEGSNAQTVQPDLVQKILNQFVDARIVTHTDDDKYNLVHDYLATYVRFATEGSESNVERANRWLKRYVAEYKEDRQTRIPYGRTRFIQKYASGELRNTDTARQVLGTSARAFFIRVSAIAAAIILPLLALFAYLSASYYIAVQDIGGYSFIVVRSGSPQLKGVPGFDAIVTQNDFILADVVKDSETRAQVQRERLTGFWFDRAPGGYERWGDEILTRLVPAPQGRGWGWIGQPERGVQVMIKAITDPTTENSTRNDAIEALGLLVSNNPQVATSELVEAMLTVLRDPESGPAARVGAANVLGDLGQANPNLVTPEVVQTTFNMVGDEKVNSDLREDQALALGQMIEANPNVATPEILAAMIALAGDGSADTDLRVAASDAVGRAGRVAAALVSEEIVQTLNMLLTDPEADADLRTEAGRALRRIAQSKPEVITPQTLQALIDIATDLQLSDALRADAADEVGQMALAQRASVTPEIGERLLKVIKNQKTDSLTRAAAAFTLGELAAAQQELASNANMQMLMGLVKDQQVNVTLRANAARAAGLLARYNSSAASEKVGQPLFSLFKDTKGTNELRGAAILALGNVVHGQPKLMNPEWIAPVMETLNDAQSDGGLRVNAARSFAELAPYVPDLVLQQRDAIYSVATVRRARGPILVALARASYAQVQSAQNVTADPFLKSLESHADSRGRSTAAHVLFLLTFDHPDQMPAVREQLSKLRLSEKPEVRIAASKALEMLTIGALYQQARANPEQMPQIMARLGALQESAQRGNNVVEDHIAFAANFVLEKFIEQNQPK